MNHSARETFWALFDATQERKETMNHDKPTKQEFNTFWEILARKHDTEPYQTKLNTTYIQGDHHDQTNKQN